MCATCTHSQQITLAWWVHPPGIPQPSKLQSYRTFALNDAITDIIYTAEDIYEPPICSHLHGIGRRLSKLGDRSPYQILNLDVSRLPQLSHSPTRSKRLLHQACPSCQHTRCPRCPLYGRQRPVHVCRSWYDRNLTNANMYTSSKRIVASYEPDRNYKYMFTVL